VTEMSTKPKAKTKGVVLVRSGVDSKEFVLPEGATLGDLLKESGATTGEQVVTIDGRPLEEFVALRPGMIVCIAPQPKNPGGSGSWRETVGTFRDDPTFQEMVDAGKAYREAQRGGDRPDPESMNPR